MTKRSADELRDRDERDIDELIRLGIIAKERPQSIARDKPPIGIAS